MNPDTTDLHFLAEVVRDASWRAADWLARPDIHPFGTTADPAPVALSASEALTLDAYRQLDSDEWPIDRARRDALARNITYGCPHITV